MPSTPMQGVSASLINVRGMLKLKNVTAVDEINAVIQNVGELASSVDDIKLALTIFRSLRDQKPCVSDIQQTSPTPVGATGESINSTFFYETTTIATNLGQKLRRAEQCRGVRRNKLRRGPRLKCENPHKAYVCYLNSVLQVLFRLKRFMNDATIFSQVQDVTPALLVAREFQKLTTIYHESLDDGPVLSVFDLRNALYEFSERKSFRESEMDDPCYATCTFLSAVHSHYVGQLQCRKRSIANFLKTFASNCTGIEIACLCTACYSFRTVVFLPLAQHVDVQWRRSVVVNTTQAKVNLEDLIFEHWLSSSLGNIVARPDDVPNVVFLPEIVMVEFNHSDWGTSGLKTSACNWTWDLLAPEHIDLGNMYCGKRGPFKMIGAGTEAAESSRCARVAGVVCKYENHYMSFAWDHASWVKFDDTFVTPVTDEATKSESRFRDVCAHGRRHMLLPVLVYFQVKPAYYVMPVVESSAEKS